MFFRKLKVLNTDLLNCAALDFFDCSKWSLSPKLITLITAFLPIGIYNDIRPNEKRHSWLLHVCSRLGTGNVFH